VLIVLPVGVFITTMPSRGGGRFVDVVGADAGSGDRLEASVAFERLGGQLDAASANGAVGFRDRLPQVFALEARADLVFNAFGPIQQFEAFPRETVEYDYFGHGCNGGGWESSLLSVVRSAGTGPGQQVSAGRQTAGCYPFLAAKLLMKSRRAVTPSIGIAL
jgi:hypothetical protein